MRLNLASLLLACALSRLALAQDGFTPLDLRPIVNMDWKDDKAGDGRGGWTDQGDNDLRGIQTGRRVFLGIPFDLIDAAKNDGKAVLTLQSRHFRAGVDSAEVEAGAKAASIYFLHASAWNNGHMATYIVHYDDGTDASIPIRAQQEITNWWYPQHGKDYRAAFHMPNRPCDDVGMVIFAWNNPSPAKTIKSIELKGLNDEGVAVVAAITLSDKPAALPDAKDIPIPDYLKSDLDILDKTQWFPIEDAPDKFGPTPIDQSATLDIPAGKHGFMKNVDGRWAFEDGAPVRLVATLHSPFAPTKKEAEYMARWLAKWGFNMVRFHALWEQVIDKTKEDSQHLDPAVMDRIDYFVNELAKRGIYTRFSMLYYRHVKKGDGVDLFDESVKFYDEKEKRQRRPGEAVTLNTVGITLFDPKVMQLNIDLEKAIMTHKNPYRDNRAYGEDPAICQIETTNEDGMFFFTVDGIPPAWKKRLDQIWGQWLLRKYGSRDKLAAAWGEDLADDEQPDLGTVKRMAIWQFERVVSPLKLVRAKDQLRFYAELNNQYFAKTKQTLRDAGVKQPINGTCWFGPGVAFWPEQYSNVGGMDYIDRHHYWAGGPGGWQILAQPFNPECALTKPELILKLGGERVIDMPYSISEWANVLPNQYRLEAPPLMAFYGNSLGGWDAPIHFAHNMDGHANGFARHLKWMWPVNEPSTLCQYPALSQLIRRRDIQEAPPAFIRNLSEEEVFSAQPIKDTAVRIDISGTYEMSSEQGASAKSLAAVYAAAVGKTGVRFTKEPKDSYSVDLGQYIDMNKKEIRSLTGELYWNWGAGCVTANTPRTQAAVGFLKDAPVKLADCQIATSNPAVSVLVSSWDGKPIKESNHLLITAVGRCRNTGMAYSRGGQRLIEIGQPPILLEGVRGSITLDRAGRCSVTALSPNGYKTADVSAKTDGGKTTIPLDGQNRAAFYEVKFE